MIDLDKLELYDLKDANGELTDKKAMRAKFRFLGLFDQRYNIVIHIRKLSARTDYFKKLVRKMILMNNCTWWNSWYNILFIFFKLKGVIKQYYKDYENELKEDLLFYID
jgi:hypothetical protein